MLPPPPPPDDGVCLPHHDWFTAMLTFGLCCGLVISYVPQHLRIIQKGSSEGISPWFLLLGSTSSASGMLNMITMQWSIVRCCRVLSLGSCLENTLGVLQVGLQWAMFTFIMILYMIFYPPHLKYHGLEVHQDSEANPTPTKLPTAYKSSEWRLSIFLSWLTGIHLFVIIFTTFFLIATNAETERWATFLGVSSAMLAAIQYMPQIIHTYKAKLVGALSIPMMLIQSPGAVLMVLSIALRPGTNWTSWITFAVAGIMQGTLLVMCLGWKVRQAKLNIDDFGEPLPASRPSSASVVGLYEDEVPGLVRTGEEDPEPAAVRAALASALESAVEGDVRSNGFTRVDSLPIDARARGEIDERTALLGTHGKAESPKTRRRWFGWGQATQEP
ncbi:hypothetical protein CYLTODRAFT_377869 [Cylindrobasidium torrendii FP15055 ss-10]|uniref:PQ-loop-domain-containing protein n=1 Tax=Cylindrobasidium torrendii FP15055 ss-10 TaxID=1314674 RepID=A0A0D7B7A9_9AGAR|nr:hypothetical protein CYLTODRAFT_377869 [Cylindrobasidium torrendii FP15055 ss-10]